METVRAKKNNKGTRTDEIHWNERKIWKRDEEIIREMMEKKVRGRKGKSKDEIE